MRIWRSGCDREYPDAADSPRGEMAICSCINRSNIPLFPYRRLATTNLIDSPQADEDLQDLPPPDRAMVRCWARAFWALEENFRHIMAYRDR